MATLDSQSSDTGRRVLPLPEVVTSMREDQLSIEEWQVTTVVDPTRSSADIHKGVMQVSVLRDPLSRYHRARAQIESRIASPSVIEGAIYDVAEYARVNVVASELGYDSSCIKDGREKLTAQALSTMPDVDTWNASFVQLLQYYGTPAADSFIRAMGKENKAWGEKLREAYKGLDKLSAHFSVRDMSDTTPFDYGGTSVTRGYRYTLRMANLIHNYLINDKSELDEGVLSGSDENDIGGDPDSTDKVPTGKRGQFAKLVWDKVELTRDLTGHLGRRRRYAQSGRGGIHADRILTDPYRRVFSTKMRDQGVIVLIDMSGSMALPPGHIEAMVEAAPGATVIGYTHSPSSPKAPNAIVLAKDGYMLDDWDRVIFGNGGNGVDGPILAYAVAIRQNNEPIIWVCDGIVTDSDDHLSPELNRICAELVVDNDIQIVGTTDRAIEAIEQSCFGLENRSHTNLEDSIRRAQHRRY